MPLTNNWKVVLVLLTGLSLRIWVALQGDFLLHPDEILQYLEQAHRLVYGNGIVPWEYRAGTRSWLIPGGISSILWTLKLFGLQSSAHYIPVVKVSFCIFSMTIPLGMYLYASRAFSSKMGWYALLLGSFWYELIAFAHKPFPGFLATGMFLLLLAGTQKPLTTRSSLFNGLLAALILALRIQYAPLLLIAAWLFVKKNDRKQVTQLFLIFALSILALGCFDWLTLGGFWHATIENIRWNLLQGISSRFGTEASSYYFEKLFFASGSLFYIALLFSLRKQERKRAKTIIALLLLTLFLHTLIGHKEYRFIFPMIPLFLVLLASLISAQKSFIKHSVFSIFLLISIAGVYNKLPYQNEIYLVKGVHQLSGFEYLPIQFLQKRTDLSIYRELGQMQNVTGVWDLTNHWFLSGGYYYLHKKIPFYQMDTPIGWKALGIKNIEENLSRLVSHALSIRYDLSKLGFIKIGKMGKVFIWKRNTNQKLHQKWCHYQPSYHQPGVDLHKDSVYPPKELQNIKRNQALFDKIRRSREKHTLTFCPPLKLKRKQPTSQPKPKRKQPTSRPKKPSKQPSSARE